MSMIPVVYTVNMKGICLVTEPHSQGSNSRENWENSGKMKVIFLVREISGNFIFWLKIRGNSRNFK